VFNEPLEVADDVFRNTVDAMLVAFGLFWRNRWLQLVLSSDGACLREVAASEKAVDAVDGQVRDEVGSAKRWGLSLAVHDGTLVAVTVDVMDSLTPYTSLYEMQLIGYIIGAHAHWRRVNNN